jgi:hypothetical protein
MAARFALRARQFSVVGVRGEASENGAMLASKYVPSARHIR